jgi:hypothetical protein
VEYLKNIRRELKAAIQQWQESQELAIKENPRLLLLDHRQLLYLIQELYASKVLIEQKAFDESMATTLQEAILPCILITTPYTYVFRYTDLFP